jgi:hypothetical protein
MELSSQCAAAEGARLKAAFDTVKLEMEAAAKQAAEEPIKFAAERGQQKHSNRKCTAVIS